MIELVIVDNHVLIRGIGIAADDGAGLDLAVLGTMFFVADTLAAADMELMAAVLGGGAGGGIGFDGDGHETEAEQAGPTGAAAG